MEKRSNKKRKTKLNNFRVPNDLYLIPSEEDDCFLLYRPTVNTVSLLNNNDAVLYAGYIKELAKRGGGRNLDNLDVARRLAKLGYLEIENNPDSRAIVKNIQPSQLSSKRFSPFEVTLDITRKCNMRCIYCYAAGGETPITMPIECGIAAIDLCVSNAKKEGTTFAVHFHGGGEPSQEFALLKKLYYYAEKRAKEEGVIFKSSVITNGLINEQTARFYSEHFDEMTISFDGDEKAQNHQRPAMNGRGTFSKVFRTAKYIYNKGKRFNIRATITSRNVTRLVDMSTFLRSEFPGCTINFEPVAIVGRAYKYDYLKCNPEVFAYNLYAAMKALAADGGMLLYSGISAHSERTQFCAASAPSFCVGADGTVTSCFSYSNKDIIRDLFIYGRYDAQANSFILNGRSLKRLRALPTNSETYCKQCFCRTHCYGDCPAIRNFAIDDNGRYYEKKDENYLNNRRCAINRKIMLMLLNDVARRRVGNDCLKIREL